MEQIQLLNVKDKIITVNKQNVLVSSDVAQLYGIQTKEVNQAVRNNPKKFPAGYLITLTKSEKSELVKNFDRFEPLKHSTKKHDKKYDTN